MPDIRHALLIGAQPENVYTALSTQEGLSAWWTPDTKAKPEINSIARFAFGDDYFKEMKIVELKPSQKVKWICITGTEEWVGTSITFGLETGDKKTLLNAHPEMTDQILQQRKENNVTLLIFHHDGWKTNSPMFAECNYTWARFLSSLKVYCETGKGHPWPNQHQ